MNEYYKELLEEFDIPTNGELSDQEAIKWFEQEQKQSKMLIDNYGESAWNIHRFMELCRAEEISESFFRQFVRMEIHKNNLKNSCTSK